MIVCSGHILGQNPDAKFTAKKHQLLTGDCILPHTGGLSENTCKKEHVYREGNL
jgi:hypothetical protein